MTKKELENMTSAQIIKQIEAWATAKSNNRIVLAFAVDTTDDNVAQTVHCPKEELTDVFFNIASRHEELRAAMFAGAVAVKH